MLATSATPLGGDAGHAEIAFVATSPYQVSLFVRSHLQALPAGVKTTIFANTGDAYFGLIKDLNVRHVPIGREPHLTRSDLAGARILWSELRRCGVNTVVTISPKAGLVGQVAARLAGVERRLHIFTGQVWESLAPGPKRSAVLAADRVIGRTATHLAADSPSQAQRLREVKVVPAGRDIAVPHPPGSIRGVDLEVFRPRPEERARLRSQWQLTEDSVAFVQIGRVTSAKGVLDLVSAFARLRRAWRHGDLPREPRLFLVGPDEECLGDRLHGDGVEVMPFTDHPELVLAGMDVLVLASHREGFGSTIIEAAAVGLPGLGTDIVGIRDAIERGVTGWLVPAKSPDDLLDTMVDIVQNRREEHERGAAAMHRVRRDFASDHVAQAWADHLMAIHCGVL